MEIGGARTNRCRGGGVDGGVNRLRVATDGGVPVRTFDVVNEACVSEVVWAGGRPDGVCTEGVFHGKQLGAIVEGVFNGAKKFAVASANGVEKAKGCVVGGGSWWSVACSQRS